MFISILKIKKTKIGLFVIALIFLVGCFTVLFINYRYSKLTVSATFFNEPQQKFWSHHGFSKKGESYSVENIDNAFEQGLKGVELDLFYNKDLNSFLVVHDISEQDTLILAELLSELNNSGEYWFDLKNLRKENTTQIIKALVALDNKYKLKNRFIVESKNVKELNRLSEAGIHTCLWISITQNKHLVIDSYRRFKDRVNLLHNDYSALSMPYYYYVREGKVLYENFPIHCWITPEEYDNNKEEILKDDRLKIVLFDRR